MKDISWVKEHIEVWYAILTDNKPAEAKVECLVSIVGSVLDEIKEDGK